jgi:hypothetical protein
MSLSKKEKVTEGEQVIHIYSSIGVTDGSNRFLHSSEYIYCMKTQGFGSLVSYR